MRGSKLDLARFQTAIPIVRDTQQLLRREPNGQSSHTKRDNRFTDACERRWYFATRPGVGLPAGSTFPAYSSGDRETLGPQRSPSWFPSRQPVALPVFRP